jgi:hypothetical protein
MRNLLPLVAVVLAIGSQSLLAQAIRLVHPVYIEHYTTPKVAGSLLVGLRIHSATGSFNPQAVSIQVEPSLRGRRVCVSVTSQDGMYYAENLYQVAPDAPAVSTFQTSTLYGKQLSSYPADQIAVDVRAIDDCNDPGFGDLVPAQLAAASGDPILVAQLNAEPDRLSVELTRHVAAPTKAAPVQATCSTGTGSRVAFTSACEFHLTGIVPGLYDLVVHLRERGRVRDIHYSVQIPGHV